ncbi:MAG: nitrilase-related carbon-nitrogen hydrolase, partial [Solirubrobacterales bacterium]
MGKDLPDIALVQINTTVGDLEGNARKILESARESVRAGARVVVFPELCLPGYPAEDLYLRSDFIEANATAIERLAPELTGATFLVGYAEPAGPNDPGRPIATEWVSSDPDRAVARIAMRDQLRQPMGILHGGVMASLVES